MRSCKISLVCLLILSLFFLPAVVVSAGILSPFGLLIIIFICNCEVHYAPNFEKVGRAYCFRLVCLSVCLSVCACVRLLTFEW